jgi:hypothetical protein
MHILSYYLPATQRLLKWKLLYCPQTDGTSYETMFSKCEAYDQTLIFIKDSCNFVFGSFNSETWKDSNRYYGTGESFVFTFRDGNDLEVSGAT